MQLVKIKDSKILIDNKPIFDKPVKSKQTNKKNKKRMKILSKCQEMMIIQQKVY